jgi:two-component system sensor histidine kinase QseC
LLLRLDSAFVREKRFASDVAHELRTPLSLLQVTLHNAQQQWLAQGVADPDGMMNALQHGVTRMSQLIEQIMLLNRTNPEHFKAKLQAMDLTALCREIIAELYPQILSKQQQIALEAIDNLMVAADPFALRVLLLNIVGNASKYTPDGGQISVSLKRIGSIVQIVVEDSGPGVAPEEYSRVFDRFYRVGGDRHQSGTPGSGLGLAIVKEIVGLHHGHLSLARSSFQTGLKVTVELPG